MLRMNAGIGRSVERAGVLERENAGLRASISELSSGDRLAAEASKLGLVLATSTPRFLDARTASARRALQSMTAPGTGIVPMTGTQADTTTTSTTSALAGTSVAPTSTTPMAADGTAATPTPTTQTPVQPTTTTSATTAPAATTTTAPPATTTTTTQQTQPAAQPAATAPPAATTGGTEAGQVG
jgi:hypothetical protein